MYVFALYFAMELTNLDDLCIRPKQIECLAWKGRYWSLNLAYWILKKYGALSQSGTFKQGQGKGQGESSRYNYIYERARKG